MIAEPPGFLGGDRFHQAEEEALATFAPKPRIFASGFLAGFFITWLPLVLYVVLYFWESTFGWAGILTNAERQWLANFHFRADVSTFIGSAWPYSILLATWGLFLAFLRAFSCLADAYFRLPKAWGSLRVGLDQLIMAVALPVAGGISFYTLYPSQVFRVWLLPIVLSGLVFNICFRFLQNAFLRMLYRPQIEQLRTLVLRVYIPWELGLRRVQIADVRLDSEQQTFTITGWFEGKSDVYERIEHMIVGLMPGYQVVIDDHHHDRATGATDCMADQATEEVSDGGAHEAHIESGEE